MNKSNSTLFVKSLVANFPVAEFLVEAFGLADQVFYFAA